jgi:hypothetical protein
MRRRLLAFGLELRRFGLLFGREQSVELRPASRPQAQHLSLKSAHRRRQLLDLRAVARLDSGFQLLPVLLELLGQRLHRLARVPENGLSLLPLRKPSGRAIEAFPGANALSPEPLAPSTVNLGKLRFIG